MPTEAEAILHTDGSSLGNPGPAGAGFVLESPAGALIAEQAIPLGEPTVGVAEYRALIAGLSVALAQGIRRVQVYSDSEFMCRQLQGNYKVRTKHIRPLYDWACKLLARFDGFQIAHIPRGDNERAAALAKQAAERGRDEKRIT